jgi:hypothetical protein
MGFRLLYSSAIVMKESEREWRRTHGATPEQSEDATLIDLRYVGVWDTVGALGVPNHLGLGALFGAQKKYQFHDTNLSSVVRSARHAVAVDEDRRSFEPALWDNLDELNQGGDSYQQSWFPGDHGSVGGGGDVVGLSSAALLWIIEGAQAQGLAFDPLLLAAHADKRDSLAALRNMSKPPGWLNGIFARGARVGPADRALLAPSTIERLSYEAKTAGWTPYRPKTLEGVHKGAVHFV